MNGQIHLKNETVATFPRYLISRGLPLPAEWAVKEPAEITLRDEQWNVLPSAGKVLQRRADGSIEWLLTDFILDFGSEQKHDVSIEHAPNPSMAVAHPVQFDSERRLDRPDFVHEDLSTRVQHPQRDQPIARGHILIPLAAGPFTDELHQKNEDAYKNDGIIHDGRRARRNVIPNRKHDDPPSPFYDLQGFVGYLHSIFYIP
jgi:hypothetical protein